MKPQSVRRCLIIVTMLALVACRPDPQPRADDAQPPRASTPASAPTTPTTTIEPPVIIEEAPSQSGTPAARGKNLELLAPAAAVTTNPFEVRGRARTFENHVTVRVLDSQKQQIAETYATATGDLGQMNPFTAEVLLTRSPGAQITVELLDFSANDGSVRERVSRSVAYRVPDVAMQLHFSAASGGTDCTTTVAVTRRLPKTASRLRATIEAILAGPMDEEKRRGLSSPFPRGVSIRGVNMKNGVAIVDFNEVMRSVGGSCRAQALRAMIEKSLLAIDGIERVEIRAVGSEPALQP